MVPGGAFSVSLSGLSATMRRVQTNSNNIANARTRGFKASKVIQEDIYGGGTKISDIVLDQKNGPIEAGDGAFALAIAGEGFFEVETEKGLRYTRAGSFEIDKDRYLVTGDGNRLSQQIKLPQEATGINISSSGEISYNDAEGKRVAMERINLARFNSPEQLRPEGGGLFAPTQGSGEAIEGNPGEGNFGKIAFGYLEGSNVELSGELVSNMISQALFKANLQVIKTENEMQGEIVDIKA